jgi:4,5-dihydroxyphthalate decarboxylase
MSEPDRVLRTLTRVQGANRLLVDGAVEPAGFSLAFEEVPVLVDGFSRMVRTLEFDVSEMALTTYLTAREHGVAFTALPIFLVRGFHHGAILYNVRSGIRTPADLEGRRVGVNRGYTVTTGVWARGILAAEYGVDLARVTWVLSGHEHVDAFVPPPNVEPARPGTDLAAMLIGGEIDAVIGVNVDHPDVAPLISEPEEAAMTALLRRNFYPINHLIVVKDDVLRRHPEVAPALFDAFAEAKDGYVARLRAGEVSSPADRTYARILQATGADPLPYGADPNRAMLEELIGHALSQRILTRPVEVDQMFAPNTVALTA